VYDFAMLVEVLLPKRQNCQVAVASIVSLEESERVAASEDSGTLVVGERDRVSFDGRDVVHVR
jgi:hypothetical protein